MEKKPIRAEDILDFRFPSAPVLSPKWDVCAFLLHQAQGQTDSYSSEAFQMFAALRYHGVESRFCLFKGEHHDLSRSGKPSARLARLHEIQSWLGRFLQPG